MKENKGINISDAEKIMVAEFQGRSLDKEGNDKKPPINCEMYRLGSKDYKELTAFQVKQMKDLEKKGQASFFDPYLPKEFKAGLGIKIKPNKRYGEIFGVYVEGKLAAFIFAHYEGDPYCEYLRENSVYDKDVLDNDKFGKFSSVISYMVDKDFQGYGLQKHMIKVLADIAVADDSQNSSIILKQKKVTHFAAEVDETNEQSYKNCYAQGFRSKSRALQYVGTKPNGKHVTKENYEVLLIANAKTIIEETERTSTGKTGSNVIKYIHSKEYDEKRLLEIINIENAVYDKKYRGTFGSIGKRYKKNEEMFIFAVDEENKMCGYICFFPISSGLTAKIENNLIMPDDNIQPHDVVGYDKDNINNIFIISVAVFPEYKGKGIGFGLTKEMFSFLSAQSISGYEIGKIFALSTSLEGEKVLSKFNFEKIHTYENKNSLLKCDFICCKDMDLYLFFPVSLASGFIKSRTVNPFLKRLVETSKEEVNSLMNERLERMYIGKVRFAPADDYGNEAKTTILEAELYLSSYRDIGTLIVEFPSICYDPTFVLDQSSRDELKVIIDNEKKPKPLYKYLSLQGLNVLGNCTHLLVSEKKLKAYYRQFVLFAEAYINRIGSKIISKEAEFAAVTNIAQYDFGEIYASGVGVIFELKPKTPCDSYLSRLETSRLMIFINEILALEIAALKLVQNAIVSEFDNSPKPSLDVIEKLIDSYGKYIILFEYNYKYNLAKCLGDKVAQRFGIAEMRKNYEANVEQLNKIVTIRSERISKEFSKKQDTLFKIISIFTLLLSINNVITLFTGINFSNPLDLAVFIVSVVLWVAAVIYLLVIWLRRIITKRRDKLKQSNQSSIINNRI